MIDKVKVNEDEKRIIQKFLVKNKEWLKNNDLSEFNNIVLFIEAYKKYLHFLGLSENKILNAFLKDIRISMFVSAGSQEYKKKYFLNQMLLMIVIVVTT